MTDLDLDTDVVTLTAALCDRESVSGDEEGLADAIETALRGLAHLEVSHRTCRPGARARSCTVAGPWT